MSFNEHIKNWVSLDNQIKQLNNRLKELKTNKNNEENLIFDYVKTNNLNNAIVKITDGKLRFGTVKQTAPITLKLVNDCLAKFIQNQEQRDIIINDIKQSRDVKYTSDIKRSYQK